MDTFCADGGIEGWKDAVEVRLKNSEEGIDLCAKDYRNPFQPLVEFLILLPAGQEKQEIDGDVRMPGRAGDCHGHAAIGLLVPRPLND